MDQSRSLEVFGEMGRGLFYLSCHMSVLLRRRVHAPDPRPVFSPRPYIGRLICCPLLTAPPSLAYAYICTMNAKSPILRQPLPQPILLLPSPTARPKPETKISSFTLFLKRVVHYGRARSAQGSPEIELVFTLNI